MSSTERPASSHAFLIASHASASSVPPEFFEYSVSPMPTMAALSRRADSQATSPDESAGPTHSRVGPTSKNVLSSERPFGPPGFGQSGDGSRVVARPRYTPSAAPRI